MKRVPVCPRRLVREKVKFQGRLQERLAKFGCFCSRRRHRDRAKVVNRRSRSRKPAAAVAASAWVFRGVAVGGTKCTRFRCDDQNSITRSLSDSEERRERLWAGTFFGGGGVERVHIFCCWDYPQKVVCETGCNHRMSVSVKNEIHVRVLP